MSSVVPTVPKVRAGAGVGGAGGLAPFGLEVESLGSSMEKLGISHQESSWWSMKMWHVMNFNDILFWKHVQSIILQCFGE